MLKQAIAPLFVLSLLSCSVSSPAQQGVSTAASRKGAMQVDVAGVVGRSDIVLQRPNFSHNEALPLGNGRLGVAVWSEGGFTAQLNRSDTLPRRYSPGQVVIPGLAAMTAAEDYGARLNLFDGTFEEHGGGMTLKAYVQPDSDLLVIDVAGADPAKPQTAILRLWEPRAPKASITGAVGVLAESWIDNEEPGSSGLTFGSLAAITAKGRDVSARVTTSRTVALTVTPEADGHFRILVASPSYKGDGQEATLSLISAALSRRDPQSHVIWWNAFWHRANLIKISSQDGSGEYMENLRNIYLFSAAAESGGEIPGSQAGEADLFSGVQDERQWDAAAFWHWNLRMQVGANLGAGLPELNEPYFHLYRSNLGNMERWTRERMRGAPGICIPETMRFNGNGIEFERWDGNTSKVTGWNCDAASGPYFNARTLTTGAEVSLWIWEQYLATGDKKFLTANFPLMAASARFLLSREKPGPDGLLHTGPSNAHETQWDVTDPVTDLAARAALYEATVEAASLTGQEPELAAQLRTAMTKIPALPRTSARSPSVLLQANDTAVGSDVIADSYQPGANIENVENIGMEPVWPYNRIGDASPEFALARRTYFARPTKYGPDWSFDAVDAARLGLGDEVRKALIAITTKYQTYINGFNEFSGQNGEFYVEQSALAALALQEALVQDYDGTIRIAPAVPSDWDFDGSVSVRGGTKVDVQVRQGRVDAVGVEVAIAQRLKLKNPWPSEKISVIDASSGARITVSTQGTVVEFPAAAGASYRIGPFRQKADAGFTAVRGTPATLPKQLGPVHIGLSRAAGGGAVAVVDHERRSRQSAAKRSLVAGTLTHVSKSRRGQPLQWLHSRSGCDMRAVILDAACVYVCKIGFNEEAKHEAFTP